MNDMTFKSAILILIISTIFSYAYLSICTDVSLATNTNVDNNEFIEYKDNTIVIEYSILDNYLTRIKKYYNIKDTMSLIIDNCYNPSMIKNNNTYIYEATLNKEIVKKYFNNYYNEKDTKIRIYFDKEKYSNLNVLNLYNKVNNETITRNKIVSSLIPEIGNSGDKYWKWYGFNHRVEWCAVFVSYIANQNDILNTKVPKFVWVKIGVDYYKEKDLLKKPKEYNPKPADLIFFDWNNNGVVDHVGYVLKVSNDSVYTIEGNVDHKDVRKKKYPLNSNYIYAYGVLDFK